MVDDLREFVGRETPTTDKKRVDAFADFLAGYASRMTGGAAEVIEQEQWGNHVRLRVGEGNQRPVLMVGHFDTVWPAGTLAQMPFSTENRVARGPGVFDM